MAHCLPVRITSKKLGGSSTRFCTKTRPFTSTTKIRGAPRRPSGLLPRTAGITQPRSCRSLLSIGNVNRDIRFPFAHSILTQEDMAQLVRLFSSELPRLRLDIHELRVRRSEPKLVATPTRR